MKIITIGEVLMRLAPPFGETLTQAESLSVRFGGSEANVAIALSGLGDEAVHITALPQNGLGQAAENFLRKYGVDTNFVVRKSGRMGVYYCEQGASVRAGKVVYDRAASVFARTRADEYDLATALRGDHLHLSGITPALGEEANALTRLAMKMAKERGLYTSFDLNFRADLWTAEQARAAFEEIFPFTDILIASSDGLDLLGLENAGCDFDACRRAAETLKERYGFHAVALTVRESVSASFNRLTGVLYGDCFSVSPTLSVNIVDRVGGGDAFAAGLLHAAYRGDSEEDIVSFANACNACKHTLYGDSMFVSEGEIQAILRGDTRIRR